ncbi:hypothetical protein [Streptomyces acidicola]|uniref:Secreted protein n=1 Tax=Streptomyces acidicola TaxID=2596892 RepID=A0A5N8X6J5_9ACTN|nr:hypothetical protein [Streptomyces acidicola]MPY54245.1 hypothetical protein [Streptomyces acidicola]
MRRIATVFSALAMAGVTALALPNPAFAAQGRLVFAGGQVIQNPSGCYQPNIWPLIVRNETNGYALVYGCSDCSGDVIAVVPPGGSTTQEFGGSVYIA